jgi:YD repeat-containing protein
MNVSRRKLIYSAGGLLGAGVLGSSQLALADDTAEYYYDALGRLIRVELSDGTIVAYYYDATGNRTTVVHGDDVPFNQTIQITGPVNLRTLADQSGYTGATNATITFQVGSAVTVIASPGAAAGFGNSNGAIAIDTGAWPSATKAISLTLQITGKVYGGGGGGLSEQTPLGGGAGGDAIYCRENINVVVNAGGELKGGGGGGGYGGGWEFSFVNSEGHWETEFRGGRGGGGGFPNGPGADGGTSGTTNGGGAGGPSGTAGGGHTRGAGGNGGGAGAAGNNGAAATGTPGCGPQGNQCWSGPTSPGVGGAAGYAIRKNGKTVNVTTNPGGVISGAVG